MSGCVFYSSHRPSVVKSGWNVAMDDELLSEIAIPGTSKIVLLVMDRLGRRGPKQG
jgi:hypothetical protein